MLRSDTVVGVEERAGSSIRGGTSVGRLAAELLKHPDSRQPIHRIGIIRFNSLNLHISLLRPRQAAVFDAMRLIGVVAEAAFAVGLIFAVIAVEILDL